MFARKIIEKKIEQKRAEITALLSQVTAAEAFVQGLEEALKALPKDNQTVSSLRPGTNLHKAYEYLKKVGKPVPLNELLKGIGLEVNKANRVSISGTLGAYVRKHSLFSRPGPNTFGLIEFGQKVHTSVPEDLEAEPPEGFGQE
jgi:hypothetical protein